MPIARCPDCGKVVSLIFPIHDCSPKITESAPHFHHWEDGTYYSHSHTSGKIPHGHHGARYGMPTKVAPHFLGVKTPKEN